MVSMLTSSVVDHRYEPQIGSNQRLNNWYLQKARINNGQEQNLVVSGHVSVSEWSDLYIYGLLFQRASIVNMQLIVLV
jgi:hypothetical protein